MIFVTQINVLQSRGQFLCLCSVIVNFQLRLKKCSSVWNVGRDSSVGIATRYDLHGPGIESRWGEARISAPVQTGSGPHPASCTMGTRSFLGLKRPGRGVDHPLHIT